MEPLGDRERQLVEFVSAHGPATSREVTDRFGAEYGLTRPTITTMLERLRAKGYLVRRKRGRAPFRYSTSAGTKGLTATLCADFVKRVLHGSCRPLINYMSEHGKLSPEEFEELRELVRRLEAGSTEVTDATSSE